MTRRQLNELSMNDSFFKDDPYIGVDSEKVISNSKSFSSGALVFFLRVCASELGQ